MAAVYQVGGSLHCQARMDKQRNAQKSRRAAAAPTKTAISSRRGRVSFVRPNRNQTPVPAGTARSGRSRRYMDSHTLYEMSASSRYSYP